MASDKCTYNRIALELRWRFSQQYDDMSIKKCQLNRRSDTFHQ